MADVIFSSVLIANRGEIAVRIMQTCRELGIRTVGVYSEPDRAALHVRMADTAYYIGPAAARESYLNGAEIIRAAVQSGAEAIHPGYGFLAENAEFAEAVVAAGLVWIGPPAASIALLGDKVASKRVVEDAGIPVIPGYAGTDLSLERLSAEAERIGYPVMLKAAAGGGGKGMRVLAGASELPAALRAAQREAAAAFGDGRVFMEKLLLRPRHVEMQILADAEGNTLYLGERDCSLQRRHQKVVEEAPSPVMTPTLRTAMGEAAVRVARVSGYVNAGTVEFLLDGDDFYFLEVNTRIQVEHPVTEAIFGLDLVRLQIQIAAGGMLPYSQLDLTMSGHAIEARLYAEDPEHGFLPSTGPLELFMPPVGPGIRNDVGVQRGDGITPYYDPMIAKLVVHAETRPIAVARLRDALDRYLCAGPRTNLPFLQWIVREPAFVAGNADIGFIDREWHPDRRESVPSAVVRAAALADALGGAPTYDPWRHHGSWRLSGVPRRRRYECGSDSYEVELVPLGGGAWSVSVQDEVEIVSIVDVRPDRIVYRTEETTTSVDVAGTPDGFELVHAGVAYRLRHPAQAELGQRGAGGRSRDGNLTAPMPGTVVSIAVTEGQRVDIGQPLVVMEAMKMEHVVEAGSAGTITAVLVHPGEMVAAGTLLVRMDT